ncbi:TetR/AcrR family transcriptional regulator [Viridibacillus sp. FSL H8-0123]|uniref:TetR/AcrR family transcriptional regulator n=1 Tax=Viridibacillus sp. FSL H8-0123 TaxID=1928922 RepID=UPI00096DD741|nr:TetR/AcrR family transcriptional regulator [Viridibacillus sp. FSL H8-0123]OMC84896.1 TetR family transcriptional regulator [Viridibacillus sp. FSL H8-0123]
MTNKNQSRERILKAATRLFHLNGYHATGLNQIIKESGAPKGSLYHHFPKGKEQLAIEAIQISASRIAAEIKDHLNTIEDPLEAFQHHIDVIAKRFDNIEDEDSLTIVPFGLIASETALVNENMRMVCEDTFLYWENLYKEKLLANGYSDEQATNISTTLNALIEGGVTLSLTQKYGGPLNRVGQMLPLLLKK